MALEAEIQERLVSIIKELSPEAAKSLSMMLNQEVSLELEGASDSVLNGDAIAVTEKSAIFSLPVNEQGPVSIVCSEKLAWIVSDLMMGNAGDYAEDQEFAAMKQTAFSESLNQAFTAAINLLQAANSDAELAHGEAVTKALNPEDAESLAKPEGANESTALNFKITIADKADESFSLELNETLAQFLVQEFSAIVTVESESTVETQEAAADGVADVKFGDIKANPQAEGEPEQNLDLLMDITMGLTVELGRSEMPLKDILKLTKGSVIELDRLSGEPVDLFVNNKLIARGEVVVIDDNFGLRITQLAGNVSLAQEMGLTSN